MVLHPWQTGVWIKWLVIKWLLNCMWANRTWIIVLSLKYFSWINCIHCHCLLSRTAEPSWEILYLGTGVPNPWATVQYRGVAHSEPDHTSSGSVCLCTKLHLCEWWTCLLATHINGTVRIKARNPSKWILPNLQQLDFMAFGMLVQSAGICCPKSLGWKW